MPELLRTGGTAYQMLGRAQNRNRALSIDWEVPIDHSSHEQVKESSNKPTTMMCLPRDQIL